ncbi:hypothetical protein THMIRHAS_03730 [Thiosulfatimonas sediminis]|uniref:Uncharacterized protein n=1 Tax=Thiosulfatimonas sediminis TaxID=2675054 RepID=A0A6F8PSN6_9GAMM|nr:tetratricopeptide repeat protein [Thiosulfatimonas sediminis]BBP45000.1 hypothetical protein THMIRHAS_03730 [Thiosulfatimonas sediminis]
MKTILPKFMFASFSRAHTVPLKRTALRSLLLGTGLLAMQGCASVDAGTPVADGSQLSQPAALSDSANSAVPADKVVSNFIVQKRLSADQMFMLLQAEMRLKRGLPEQAYQIYHQLAQETQDPEIAQHAFNVSMTTFQPQNISEAVKLWRTIDPNVEGAWRASFVLSLRAGDVSAAFTEWQKYADLTAAGIDQDILVAAKRASSAMVGDLTFAQQFMQRIVDEYPQQWASYLGLGMIAASQKDFALALQSLKKTLTFTEFGEKSQVYSLLAQIYLQMGEYQEGVTQLRSYAQQYPDDTELQERLARLEVQAGMNQAAQARYQQIVEQNPQQHSAKFALALLLLDSKDFETAKTLFNQLMEISAYQEVANYYLGYALQEQGQNKEALAYFSKVESAVYKTDALLHQAEIYFSQNDKAQAYERLQQVDVSVQANQIKMLLAKAIFLRLEDQYQQSVDTLTELLEIQPDHQRALLEQANLFYFLERFAEYESNMQQLLHLDQNNVDALNGLGYYYAENGINLAQAKTLIERAIQIEPDNFFILDSMGWVLFQQKEYNQAVQYLEKAYAVEKDEVVAEHLIRAYWMAGMKEKAQGIWIEYLERFKQNQALIDLQEWIQQGK